MNRDLRRYLLEGVLLTLLSVAVFAPWGCGRSPLAPAHRQTGTFALPNGIVAHPGTLLGGTTPAEPGTFALIPNPFTLDTSGATDPSFKEYGPFTEDVGVLGGTIELEVDQEYSYFTVPPDALLSQEEISVSVARSLAAVDHRTTEFHFGPEGLKFEIPAILSFCSRLKDGETLLLYWWDPEAEAWLKSAEAVVVDGYASFPIDHFSKYRTTERISLGGQRGSK